MPVNALATRALLSCRQAVMASQSASVPGFPFTTVIPVSITPRGQIIALLNENAQHTRNVMIDPRISMLMHDDIEENWQAATRLSVLGYLRPLQMSGAELEITRHSFYLLHPELKDFDQTLDFHFWVLEPVRFRLISGIERVNWIDAVKPDLFELMPQQREALNEILAKYSQQSYVIQACRYGMQIFEQGRVRFLALKEPVEYMSELIEQMNAGQFDDPALTE
ncbi:hypothetical protein [Aquirhabdus parva]|uniref:CREG-like beta-barrel domain-containing protein n=1 Tax=Aquirhabdus parva TaxID=2283318 RepID=A0A345P4J8_9GAMM|nr:hypothetical protein [Aquirhabdus parva]AXI02207.1 hypothetical protein HYN46_04705 [Aquirhabdus parva]